MRVIDASALLAFLFREPGHDRVAGVLGGSFISAINLSEVMTRFVRDGHDPTPMIAVLQRLGVEIVAFDTTQAALAASLSKTTRALGLSLGDRACLALAHHKGAVAVTADREWLKLPPESQVQIELIR